MSQKSTQSGNTENKRAVKQIISSRYLESLQNILHKYNFQYQHHPISPQNKEDQQQDVILTIKECPKAESEQNIFYFGLMKKFYNIRKVVNPQITFENFLTLYNQQIQQRLKRLHILDHLKDKNPSTQLNKLILLNQYHQLKQQTISLIKDKQPQIHQLQSQSKQVNQQYEYLVTNLLQKNAELNVQNIQIQLKLKQKQKQNKNAFTQSFLPKSKNNLNQKNTSSKQEMNTNPNKSNKTKEELERIKTVIKNNMWGYGQQITQKLSKLNSLKAQLNI